MPDDGPSFEIYQDPPDQHGSSARDNFSQPVLEHHPNRVVLAEIKLPTWGTEVHCNSALKHEMLPLPPPQSESSSLTDTTVLSPSLEEIKENLVSNSIDVRSLKTPPRKPSSPGIKRTTPTHSSSIPSTVPLRI